MSKEFSFCRFDGYWCVECCEVRPCCNFGELPDKTRGCLGYDVKSKEEAEIAGVFMKLDTCEKFNCLEGRVVNGIKIDTPEISKKIYEAIKKRSAGEYRMDTDIIKPMLANLRK